MSTDYCLPDVDRNYSLNSSYESCEIHRPPSDTEFVGDKQASQVGFIPKGPLKYGGTSLWTHFKPICWLNKVACQIIWAVGYQSFPILIVKIGVFICKIIGMNN